MNDALDSLKDNMKERLTSPILGSFLVLFVCKHWQFFVLLVWSDKHGPERVAQLQSRVPNSWEAVVAPALEAVALAIGYALLTNAYTLFLKWIQELRLDRETRITDKAKHARDLQILALRLKRTSAYNIRVANYASLMIDALKDGIEQGVLGKAELHRMLQVVERAANDGKLTGAEEALHSLDSILYAAAHQKSLPANYVDTLLRCVENMCRQGTLDSLQYAKIDEFYMVINKLKPKQLS